MKITKNGTEIKAVIEGKLDRTSSPDFENDMNRQIGDDTKYIELDLSPCIYVSSAGLRAILALEKKMAKSGGKLVIRNVPELVMEVFTETGLDEILTLE